MFRRTHALPVGMALLAAGALVAGCSGGGSASSAGSGNGAPVTIKAVLPPNTGPITAADNAGLKSLTTQYEAAHKNVTVQWLPNNIVQHHPGQRPAGEPGLRRQRAGTSSGNSTARSPPAPSRPGCCRTSSRT